MAKGGTRAYYSRPALITGSYEARRHLAVELGKSSAPARVHTEIFEYHWSYLMTGNKVGDLVPTTLRLLLRRPRSVPAGLRGPWWLVWGLVLLAVVAAVVLYLTGLLGVLGAVLAVPVVGLFGGLVANLLAGRVTSSFVDVVRYLDTSPRSYSARRAIRGGMVDLLRALQDTGSYSRVIVVAHSLGAYIAYDGIATLWTETAAQTAGPVDEPVALGALEPLEHAAVDVRAGEVTPPELQAAQFALWKDLRRQGNPWLITDFLTLGTPMCFAHLLYTRNRAEFEDLVTRAELPQCPPQSRTRTVDGPPAQDPRPSYGRFNRNNREVLDQGAPFAVTRWTNMWFPATGLRGDWFGGPLRPLFGPGIHDVAITGNLPGREGRGVAHGRYFDFPEDTGPDDVATRVRAVINLGTAMHVELALLAAPDTDPATAQGIAGEITARQPRAPHLGPGA